MLNRKHCWKIRTLEKLAEALNVGKSIVYMQWERLKRKANVSYKLSKLII